MADFRKWILVLAVVALVTSPAFGQYNCNVSPAVNRNVRAGGITERVGDFVITCPVQPGFTDAAVNFTALLSNTVTNRVLGADTGQGLPIAAGLQIIDSVGGVYEAVQGLLQTAQPPAARNQVVFPNVVVPRGTTSAFTIRIFNIRVAVSPTASPSTPIFESIVTSNPSVISVPSSNQQVATPFTPLSFAVTDCNGGSLALAPFKQCTPYGHLVDFGVTFREGYQSAFRTQGVSPGTAGPGTEESGDSFNIVTYPGSVVGALITDAADNGTQLEVTFTNVPAGVSIAVTGVPTHITPLAGVTNAAIVNPASSVGTATNCGSLAMYPATFSGTTATAAWEITADDQFNIESLTFGVDIYYTPSLPTLPALTGAIPGQILGTLAPVSTDLFAALSPDPIVRFQDYALSASSPLTIIPCVTNLLFPYVVNTNEGGMAYDTGIALANTSKDNAGDGVPFATDMQTGKCRLYFFGNNAVATYETTTDVAPGTVQGYVLSTLPGAAGFQGYIIARCDFQYAHGFAYIVDGNLPGFGSESYLALVIPDRGSYGRPADPFTTGGTGTGEQLVP